MKYIISRDEYSFPPFVCRTFPESEQHSEVVREMKGKVLGAGFAKPCRTMFGLAWVCYGESTSLNIRSRGEEDSNILDALMQLTFR